MNILILFSHRWRGGRAGGAETYTIQLIQGLAARGHSVFLATEKVDPASKTAPASLGKQPAGVAVDYELPFQTLNPLKKRNVSRQIQRIAEARHIDIVHAQHRTAGYFAEWLWRKHRVPYVVTVHDPWHATPFKKWHGGLFRQVIAVSDFLRQLLIRDFHFPPERVHTIRNGVEPSRFAGITRADGAPIRAQYGIAPDEVVLSQVSRISRAKGQHDLVEALALLPRDLNYRCLIFGEGSERPRLEQLAIRRSLQGKVQFCGFRADIPVVFAATDVMLLPSRREGLPLAVVEAMLSNVAVIAARTAGVPEIITHGEDGLLFEACDVRALAAHIERLVTDAELRRRLAEAGRKTAQARFLVSRVLDETEACYREIIAQAHAELEAQKAR
ncbi:MAG: glycosyltransferase family 4 protein [Terriglobales bacterium]